MNNTSRKRLLSLGRPVGLMQLLKWTGQNVVFPFYHTISEHHLPHISHLYRVMKPLEFERDLDRMLKLFEPLGLSDYLEQKGGTRTRPGMVLTFDDGLKGCRELIAPILQRKGVPATFFLNNRFIDNRGLFYRYKAGLLIDRMREDCRARENVQAFLKVPEEQVEASVRMIGYRQGALLDALARQAELDFSSYLRSKPVYMNQQEIKELLRMGFEIGAHSSDHLDFRELERDEMINQVEVSMEDLYQRFEIQTRYFSFPFSSDGVPKAVIDDLLNRGVATALLGTSGLKRTGKRAFIQRIPMEQIEIEAMDVLKSEYLYYLLKGPFGRNRLRY